MTIVLFLHLMLALSNAAVGTYVLIRDPKSFLYRIFFAFTLGIAGWITGMAMLMATQQFLWVAPTLLSAEIAVITFALFSERFPYVRNPRIGLVQLVIPWAIIVVLTPWHLFISSVSVDARGYLDPENGPLFPIFAIGMAVYMAIGFYYLTQSLRESRGVPRIQLRYFLWGVGILIGSGFLFDILLPAFGIFSFNIIGPLCSSVFVAFTAYAILRYHFLDIHIVVKRSVSYAVAMLAAALIFFSIEFIVEKFFYNDEIVDIFAAMVGALAFAQFKVFFEWVTDRIFFRADYDYRDAVRNLGLTLNASIESRHVIASIDRFLSTTIKPAKVVFFLASIRMWFVSDHVVPGAPVFRELPGQEVGNYESLHGVCQSLSPEVVVTEKDNSLQKFFGGPSSDVDQGAAIAIARKSDIAAIVPFLSKNSQINAIMFIGGKLSGDILRPKDIGLLSVIAHQGGMAVENAELYETIRRHNEELEGIVAERTNEVRDLYRKQEEFMTNISHQLQTPIAILDGNLELATARSTGTAKRFLRTMRGTLDGMALLVADFLEIAKLNFSKNMFYKSRLDVGVLVEESCEDCLVLAETKGVRLSYSAQKSLMVVGDRKKFKEVLLNLLSNALKHTNPGGTITLRAARHGAMAEIAVCDTGTGISPENLAHIFERFYRIPGADVRGNGLGLNICREIIALHGGTIEIESAVGEGSVFTVKLPLAPEPDVVASGIL